MALWMFFDLFISKCCRVNLITVRTSYRYACGDTDSERTDAAEVVGFQKRYAREHGIERVGQATQRAREGR